MWVLLSIDNIWFFYKYVSMNKPKMTYFEENDVLHLVISEENEAGGVELSPNITAELNDKGDLIGLDVN